MQFKYLMVFLPHVQYLPVQAKGLNKTNIQIQDGNSLLSLTVHNKSLKTTLKTKDVKVKDTSQDPVSIHRSNKI